MGRVLIVLLIAPLLAGCETTKGSVAGSCAVFERPPYAVRGVTSYDQRVADGFVESGVAGCAWERPAKRPAALDAPIKKAAAKSHPKKNLLQRAKDNITEKVWPDTAAPLPPSPPIEAPHDMTPPVAPLPPPPPTALQKLLGGRP